MSRIVHYHRWLCCRKRRGAFSQSVACFQFEIQMAGKHSSLKWLPFPPVRSSIGHLTLCRVVFHNCGRKLTKPNWPRRSAHKKPTLDRSPYRNVCYRLFVPYLSKTRIGDSCAGYYSESSDSASSWRVRTRLLSHLSLFGSLTSCPNEQPWSLISLEMGMHCSCATHLSAWLAILYANET